MTEPADYQRLYDNLRAHAPGTIQSMLQAELFEVVRDFCQHTNIYNYVETIVVSNASNSYPLSPPAASAIKRILSISDISNSIQPPFISVRWPAGLTLPSTLVLFRQLNNTYTWQVQSSLYPVDPTDGNGDPQIPNWILDNYFDTFFSGVLWRMHAQKAKPYSDAQLAATRYRLYTKGRGEAAADVLRQNIYNAQAWFYPGAGTVTGRQRGV